MEAKKNKKKWHVYDGGNAQLGGVVNAVQLVHSLKRNKKHEDRNWRKKVAHDEQTFGEKSTFRQPTLARLLFFSAAPQFRF